MKPSAAEKALRSAKLHIEEIRTKKFSIGKTKPNPLTLDLHHAVTSLSAELYQKDIHFLMELIQNAEDNEYKKGVEPTLEFVLTKKDITGSGAPATLLVFNNEVGFSRSNIDSICSVGRSTKKGKRHLGYIGEKGIGFKSVFLVSSQPHIFSNGYRVKFREEPNKDCSIGYIVPEWVSGEPTLSSILDVYGVNKVLPTTTIVLPLKPEKVETVRAQLSGLHPELLLFLSKVNRVYVRGCDPKAADGVSTISICTGTDLLNVRDKTANARVVELSVKEKMGASEEKCKYYLWRQAFPVKHANRVNTRMNVEEWVITLAFPFGNRLRRGTSFVGVFAFLPTAMVTSFPFVIQADFILASSRESILLDNVWNLGILECVPSAFVNAFESCVKELSLFPSVGQAFQFIPTQASPIPVFNKLTESIKTRLQGLEIVPCEIFSGKRWFFQPKEAVRIIHKFRDLLVRIRSEGVVLSGLSSLMKVSHSSLNFQETRGVMDYLGVVYASYNWYAQCIKSCNIVPQVSDDVYIKLLGFIADTYKDTLSVQLLSTTPLLKYINREGNMELRTVPNTTPKIVYSVELEIHTWLSKCNMEFGCLGNFYFLPNSTQEALLTHKRSSFLLEWLSRNAGLSPCSATEFVSWLYPHVSNKEPLLSVALVHFLYHAHMKNIIDDSQLYSFLTVIPLIDGTNQVRMQRTATLVSASRSKWVKLLGPLNPFVGQYYIDIGDVYSESSMLLGESVPQDELLRFVVKFSKAVDIPELCPPDVVLQIASHELSSEKAFLLLDWIRLLRTKGSLPTRFLESIRNGKWMKTYLGYCTPRQAILTNETGEGIFDMMKHILEDISILDLEFYSDRIMLYQDELEFLGVGIRSVDVQRLVTNRFMSLASPGMSKEHTFSLLTFITFSKARGMLDMNWFAVMKEKKWLKTHKGYNAPEVSIILPSEIDTQSCLKVTDLPIVDDAFYGTKLSCLLSELRLLGVIDDMKKVQIVIAENLTLPADPSSRTSNCFFLILKCIRSLGSEADGLMKRIIHQPWIKTNFGFRCPAETVLLPDAIWGSLLSTLEVPVIDELYYRNEIRHFVDELNVMGVGVDTARATDLVATQFNSLLHSSSGLAPEKVMALLGCIRELSQTMALPCPELTWLSSEQWLKTRHGYRSPSESIISSSKWGSISWFVDLPIIDDINYGIGIYKFRDELQKLGVITDFEGGAPFVAKGLRIPFEAELVSADGMVSLLECIKSLMSRPPDELLLTDFLNNIAKSRCLKTGDGYKTPEECILFDPSWESILKRSDAPKITIDEKFYGTDILAYKDQLRGIGVNVDPLGVCSLISGLLFSLTDTSSITRIYGFLSKFHWCPEALSNLQVWIPNPNGTGVWVNSQDCILYDRNDRFGSCLFCLENFYSKEILPIFSSAFGVAENPSTKDYLQLWNSWALRGNGQVTMEECSFFWEYVFNNWNPELGDTLKGSLTKLPATMSVAEEIFLISTGEVFIGDDLQLKKNFSSFDKAPLFVWFPHSNCLPSVPPIRLYEFYESLGVRKLSESVECNCNMSHTLSLENWEKVDPSERLIRRGLMKIILGFLARPHVNMPLKRRHEAAKSVLELSVYKGDKPIQVCYRLMQSAGTVVEVEKLKLVLWEKNSQRLLIKKSAYESGKTDIEFVTCFADELAQGVLAQTTHTAADTLSRIIQMGFMFDFNENDVDFLLTEENLELFVEDALFLDAAFLPSGGGTGRVYLKRSCKKSELLEPLTPMEPCKKQRQG